MRLVCVHCRNEPWPRNERGYTSHVCIHMRRAVEELSKEAMSGGVTLDGKRWVLVLEKYHRDNLLLLLNAIGWPYPYRNESGSLENPHVDPDLARYNTGDWNGELPQWLAKPKPDGHWGSVIDENDSPNRVQPKLAKPVE